MTEVWLTYAQAGERFGLTSDAIRMRARRRGWRSQPGNEGRTLILVPDDTTIEPRSRSLEGSPKRTAEQSEIVERFLDRIEAADARAATSEHRAEQAERRAERFETRAEHAEQRADAERARADQLRETLDITAGELAATERRLREKLDLAEAILGIAQRQAREAEQERDRAEDAVAVLRQAETDRKAKGLLARLRDAWKGK
jgi:hypothetical protein